MSESTRPIEVNTRSKNGCLGCLIAILAIIGLWAVIFGTDETAVDHDPATGEARGEYRMNFETGQFEFVKQSQLNKEKESNPFSPDFNGMRIYDPPSDIKGFVLKGLGEKKEPEATK